MQPRATERNATQLTQLLQLNNTTQATCRSILTSLDVFDLVIHPYLTATQTLESLAPADSKYVPR